MGFVFEERASDSPLVEKVWRVDHPAPGTFTSVAESHWEMVVTRLSGKTFFTVRGPETHATTAECPPEGEFFGIQFKLGTFMPDLPVNSLVNTGRELPEASSRKFWLQGTAWELPDFDNADVFVQRLMRAGLIAREPLIDTALRDQVLPQSVRSVQRRFLHATGLTQGEIRQIERAKTALTYLYRGASILDAVGLAGYADQPHLTRSLRRLLGVTPAQVVRAGRDGAQDLGNNFGLSIGNEGSEREYEPSTARRTA